MISTSCILIDMPLCGALRSMCAYPPYLQGVIHSSTHASFITRQGMRMSRGPGPWSHISTYVWMCIPGDVASIVWSPLVSINFISLSLLTFCNLIVCFVACGPSCCTQTQSYTARNELGTLN